MVLLSMYESPWRSAMKLTTNATTSPEDRLPFATNRIEWADCPKGIGISLVVFGHVQRSLVESGVLAARPFVLFVDRYIYPFHMPLFSFVAGLFMAHRVQRAPGIFVAHLARALLYPYLIWSIVQTAIQASMAAYINGTADLSRLMSIA
jgi:fucose 4-O-acetylase-like acetyltransferase